MDNTIAQAEIIYGKRPPNMSAIGTRFPMAWGMGTIFA